MSPRYEHTVAYLLSLNSSVVFHVVSLFVMQHNKARLSRTGTVPTMD